MQTRKRKQEDRKQKLEQKAQRLCNPFTINPTIKKPALYYRKKWRKVRKVVKAVTRKLEQSEKALASTLASAIRQKVRRFHEYSDLEVVVQGVPAFFWRKVTKNWGSYIPIRRRKGYNSYKKTHKASAFLQSFSGVHLEKRVSSEQVMKITIGKKAAARVMYNSTSHVMALTFWYEPFPFPLGWIPMFKGNTSPKGNCKHKTFWLEKGQTK